MESFIYSWHVEDENIEDKEEFVIRAYGKTSENQLINITIKDFTPYFYIELPEDIKWSNTI